MKNILFGLLLVLSLDAETYEYDFSVSEDVNNSAMKIDPIMNGRFSEIIRFNAILFGENTDENNSAKLDEIADKIKEYNDRGEEIVVTIIGHTEATTDDKSEEVVDSDTYANTIQNVFRDTLGVYCSSKLSEEYARDVQEALTDRKIDENLTIVEYRNGQDLAFSDATDEGRDLSNRVMVALYVLVPKDEDVDEDGVMDSVDRCLNTPKGIKVNKYGCPVDTDGDGVLDNLDKCADTPKGVNIDKDGCPLDSDSDGVLDYKDRCTNTMINTKIDEYGCPIISTLKINFQSKSAKISKDYHPKIVEFAKFLEKYPEYNAEIIGHTDSIGKEAINMKLSSDRAASVKSALESEGIASTRISSGGRGELDPVSSNRTALGRSENRRIEVVLSY